MDPDFPGQRAWNDHADQRNDGLHPVRLLHRQHHCEAEAEHASCTSRRNSTRNNYLGGDIYGGLTGVFVYGRDADERKLWHYCGREFHGWCLRGQRRICFEWSGNFHFERPSGQQQCGNRDCGYDAGRLHFMQWIPRSGELI